MLMRNAEGSVSEADPTELYALAFKMRSGAKVEVRVLNGERSIVLRDTDHQSVEAVIGGHEVICLIELLKIMRYQFPETEEENWERQPKSEYDGFSRELFFRWNECPADAQAFRRLLAARMEILGDAMFRLYQERMERLKEK
jgi:hypothetical protein